MVIPPCFISGRPIPSRQKHCFPPYITVPSHQTIVRRKLPSLPVNGIGNYHLFLLKKYAPPEITIPSRQQQIFRLKLPSLPVKNTFPVLPGIFQRLFPSRHLYIKSTYFLAVPITDSESETKAASQTYHLVEQNHGWRWTTVQVTHDLRQYHTAGTTSQRRRRP